MGQSTSRREFRHQPPLLRYSRKHRARAFDQNSLDNFSQLLKTAGASKTALPSLLSVTSRSSATSLCSSFLASLPAILFVINCSAFILYGVTALFGPVFIPLLMTDRPFAAKFFHFLDVLISFAMIRAVAAAFIFVWAGFMNAFIQQTFNGNYSMEMWLANLIPVHHGFRRLHHQHALYSEHDAGDLRRGCRTDWSMRQKSLSASCALHQSQEEGSHVQVSMDVCSHSSSYHGSSAPLLVYLFVRARSADPRRLIYSPQSSSSGSSTERNHAPHVHAHSYPLKHLLRRSKRCSPTKSATRSMPRTMPSGRPSRFIIGCGTVLLLRLHGAQSSRSPTDRSSNRYIRIDEMGRAQAIQYSDLNYSPREGEVRTYLTDWANYRYTISRDTIAKKYPLNYYFLSQHLASQLMTEDNQNHLVSQVMAGQIEQSDVEVKNVTITSHV